MRSSRSLTRPHARAGRGRREVASAVEAVAVDAGIPVLAPARASDPDFLDRLVDVRPDCCPVVAYGALLPASVLAIPRYGWVNLHFSLLPAWRGAAPVQRAILHGDEVTGASTFQIETGLDTGPLYGVVTEAIRPDDTSGALLARLARSGADLLVATMDGIADASLVARPQSIDGVSVAAKVMVDDARVDWSAPAQHVDRLVRACTPTPGAWTLFRGDRLKLGPVRIVSDDAAKPGELCVAKDSVRVGTATATVELGEVQPPGKRPMRAADWARGVRLASSERLWLAAPTCHGWWHTTCCARWPTSRRTRTWCCRDDRRAEAVGSRRRVRHRARLRNAARAGHARRDRRRLRNRAVSTVDAERARPAAAGRLSGAAYACAAARGGGYDGRSGPSTGDARAAGFVNAVLRKVVAARLGRLGRASSPPGATTARRLAMRYAHPEWIVAAFARRARRRPGSRPPPRSPPTTAPARPPRRRPGQIDRDELAVAGRAAKPGPWSPYRGTISRRRSRRAGRGAARSSRGVQDEGSQLVALALARAAIDGPRRAVAGPVRRPGRQGRSARRARRERGARVTRDRAASASCRAGPRRAGAGWTSRCRSSTARRVPGHRRPRFDRVLVDAPCSGLGALRRRPEARWRRRPADLAGLERAAARAAHGRAAPPPARGVVAYVTCSPHLAETRRGRCVARHDRAAGRAAAFPGVPDLGDGPSVQLWPHRHGTDAMFCALGGPPDPRMTGIRHRCRPRGGAVTRGLSRPAAFG